MALDQSGDGGSHGTSPGRNYFTWGACRQSRVRGRGTAPPAIGAAGGTARRAGRRAAAARTGHRRRSIARRGETETIGSPQDVWRQYDSQRGPDARAQVEVQRTVGVRRNDSRRVYGAPGYSNRGGYGSRRSSCRGTSGRESSRSCRTAVRYRPSIGLGVFYGSSGAYPYGHTPRGYFDLIPGRAYGGLRITDAPHEAQVFADGYYVGIVDDFDGVFQHLNLEAGPHRIEVRLPGYSDAVEFDVLIQPGRTVTFRADW